MLRYKTWFLFILLPFLCLGQNNDVILSCGAIYTEKEYSLSMNLGETCNALFLSESASLKAGVLQFLPITFNSKPTHGDGSSAASIFQYHTKHGVIEFTHLDPASTYLLHIVGISGQVVREYTITKEKSYQLELTQFPRSALFLVVKNASNNSQYTIKLWNL